MRLEFETTGKIGKGQSPSAIQFENTSMQLFSVKDGGLYGSAGHAMDGYYDDPTFEQALNVSPDEVMEHVKIRALAGFGAVGAYKTGNQHKLITYEFAYEMDRFLEHVTLESRLMNPVASFSLNLANPPDEGSATLENVAINESKALLSPGARVEFRFTMGDHADVMELGTYYIDRSAYNVMSPTVEADGRNIVGKALIDQTLNENHKFDHDRLDLIMEKLLLNANLISDQFAIQTAPISTNIDFNPNVTVLEAIKEILKLLPGWRIEALSSGLIVIAEQGSNLFETKSIYDFERGVDIMSREVQRDDMHAYRKVCVHTSDFTVSVFRDVEAYSGWNLSSNKTLYATVPDGASVDFASRYADELASRLQNVGKVETFTGPFRPYLTVGDGARITNASGGRDNLGIITEIRHEMGRSGFLTTFVVDSGGQIGRGRISDYIDKMEASFSVMDFSDEDPVQNCLICTDEFENPFSQICELCRESILSDGGLLETVTTVLRYQRHENLPQLNAYAHTGAGSVLRDVEIIADVYISGNARPGILLCGDGPGVINPEAPLDANQTGYFFYIGATNDYLTVECYKEGENMGFKGHHHMNIHDNNWYRLRVSRVGTNFKFKAWRAIQEEPPEWHIEFADSTLTHGYVGFTEFQNEGASGFGRFEVNRRVTDFTRRDELPSDWTVLFGSERSWEMALFSSL